MTFKYYENETWGKIGQSANLQSNTSTHGKLHYLNGLFTLAYSGT